MEPLVSVVIPTCNRPQLVTRAVQSALIQTLTDIEVIVVIDGVDESTRNELAKIADSRLRIIELPTREGAPHARNVGILEAKGKWVALLDDDDEWLPQKLKIQLDVAEHSKYPFPIITCSLFARTPRADYIWPRRFPEVNEPISEYLLARNSLFRGEASIQTSTFFASRNFLAQNLFKQELLKHQDIEWVLRISVLDSAKIEFLKEPLVIHYIEGKSETVSSKNNWEYSLRWVQEHKHLMTPRAYAAFIMTYISPEAAKQKDWKAFHLLLKEALRFGKPAIIDWLIYLGLWAIPQSPRRWLRDLWIGKNTAVANFKL
jgi:glycosyltransferase involved in cell wall biosynthesis